jgi:VWFA-related protein
MMSIRGRAFGAVIAGAVLLATTAPAQTPAPPAPAQTQQTAPAQQEPRPVFRAGADAVTVDASVMRDKKAVPGLKPADFEILDNGVAQEVTDIAYERLPIDVTVLLDVSASVTGRVLDELRRALHQLRADLGPNDRLRLITFNMGIRRLVDFGQPTANLDQALASLRATGSSAIFDSLAVALSAAAPNGRRQLIVLFSDGQDSSSISDADTLLDVAKRSTPTVGVILSVPSLDRPASLLRTASPLGSASVGVLSERLASETGGFVTAVEQGENLTSKFRRVLDQFRSSYVLYFTPQGVERGGAHTLEVRVKRQGMEVRSRRGYVWR